MLCNDAPVLADQDAVGILVRDGTVARPMSAKMMRNGHLFNAREVRVLT
jgi:hypothetical protein